MIRTGIRTSVSAWVLFGFATVGWAGELPLEAAWAELDGPQPRDPGPVLVFRQAPLNTGGPGADTAFINNSGQPSWQRTADEFSLPSDGLLSRVVWWGFYGGDFDAVPEPAPSSEAFWVRLYQPSPSDGLPGIMIHEEIATNPLRTTTGRIIGTGAFPPERQYAADLTAPLALVANQVYWLEITQIDLPVSTFRWEVSLGSGSPFAFQNGNVTDWRRTTQTSNLSFELYAIPEPSSAFILIMGCILIDRRLRGGR